MTVVCIDTHVLSWGLLKHHTHNIDPVLVKQAEGLLALLDEQKATVVIPSIVVAEILVVVPTQDHAAVLEKFQSDWLIVDFDLLAAGIFARLRADDEVKKIVKRLQNDTSATRKELNADLMIIATAIAGGAEHLYSHDDKLLSLARKTTLRAEDFALLSSE